MAKLKHRHLASAPSAYENGSACSTSEPYSKIFAPSVTLMALWLKHKSDCRSISQILIEARSGNLPGVSAGALPDQFEVINEIAALAAMRKEKSL